MPKFSHPLMYSLFTPLRLHHNTNEDNSPKFPHPLVYSPHLGSTITQMKDNSTLTSLLLIKKSY